MCGAFEDHVPRPCQRQPAWTGNHEHSGDISAPRSVSILAIVKRLCLRSVAALGIDQQRARLPSRLAAPAQ